MQGESRSQDGRAKNRIPSSQFVNGNANSMLVIFRGFANLTET